VSSTSLLSSNYSRSYTRLHLLPESDISSEICKTHYANSFCEIIFSVLNVDVMKIKGRNIFRVCGRQSGGQAGGGESFE
jgi:hypothetical protein